MIEKWQERFLQIFSIIGGAIVLATPYRMDVFELSSDKSFLFLGFNILTPVLLGLMVASVIGAFRFANSSTLKSEITMLVCSTLAIPSIFMTTVDIGTSIPLCGPITSYYLPSLYIAIVYFAVLFGFSIFLMITKKKYPVKEPEAFV